MPEEITRYICDYCGIEYDFFNECKRHEYTCPEGADNKTCSTCNFHSYDYACCPLDIHSDSLANDRCKFWKERS